MLALVNSALWFNAATLVLWVMLWQLGRLVEYTEHASVWFPVAGLTFAVLLLEGARLVPALLGGCVIVTIWVGRHYGLALSDLELALAGVLFAAAHIGSYALGARLLRKVALLGSRELPLLVVSFLLIAAVSSLLATGTGLAALVYSGMMPAADVGSAWLPYWIGDLAGVIALAPFFGAALVRLNPSKNNLLHGSVHLDHQRASSNFKYKLISTLALLAASMWLAHATRSQNSAFAIFFLVIPYMWIASTESASCNVLCVAVGSFTIALLVHAFGLKEFSMVYQFAINVIAANTLFALALPTLLADNIALRKITDTDLLTQAASRLHLEQRARLAQPTCWAASGATNSWLYCPATSSPQPAPLPNASAPRWNQIRWTTGRHSAPASASPRWARSIPTKRCWTALTRPSTRQNKAAAPGWPGSRRAQFDSVQIAYPTRAILAFCSQTS